MIMITAYHGNFIQAHVTGSSLIATLRDDNSTVLKTVQARIDSIKQVHELMHTVYQWTSFQHGLMLEEWLLKEAV